MFDKIRKKIKDVKRRSKIPRGYYCYFCNKTTEFKDRIICPYWRLDTTHTKKQGNGYCEYLGKSDWDLNNEYAENDVEVSVKQKNGTYKVYIEKYKNLLPTSLLWDQVKMCDKR